MSELESVGSDPAPDTAVSTPAETPNVETVSEPSKTTREALERAFRSVDEQPRDDAGKWTKEQADAKAAKAIEDAKADLKAAQPQAEAPVEPAKEAAPVAEIPSRLSAEAKAEWAKTPPAVQAEVNRAINELTRGLEGYQQRFASLKPYEDAATRSGTTLAAALESYTGIEDLLRADPVKGFTVIAQNLGLDTAAIAAALSGQPSQGGAAPQEAVLLNRIAELEKRLSGVSDEFTRRDITTQVQDFAAKNPRFDELSETIAEMLRTGFAKDLTDAYAKADRLHPAPQAPVIPQAPAPRPQTPKPSLQITGSPNSGSDPATRPVAGSPRDALRNAFAQVGI